MTTARAVHHLRRLRSSDLLILSIKDATPEAAAALAAAAQVLVPCPVLVLDAGVRLRRRRRWWRR